MGDSTFAFNQNTQTPEGDPLKFRRMEYYMSGFVLVHDGGQITKLTDIWLLIKGNTPVNVLLGTHAITTLEEIRFAIGVQPEYNHLDPSTYAPGHPLAPKSPSMHWGWEAGYRFVALEGSGGTNRDQNIEIHSLSDVNYLQIKIPTAGTKIGNDLTIELNADYTQALKGIETLSGVVLHGDDLEAAELTMNFVNHVFTSSEGNGSALNTPKISSSNALLFPNPSRGSTNLTFTDGVIPTSIRVFDQQGKCVDLYEGVTEEIQLSQKAPGVYLISLEYADHAVQTVKWVVTP